MLFCKHSPAIMLEVLVNNQYLVHEKLIFLQFYVHFTYLLLYVLRRINNLMSITFGKILLHSIILKKITLLTIVFIRVVTLLFLYFLCTNINKLSRYQRLNVIIYYFLVK